MKDIQITDQDFKEQLIMSGARSAMLDSIMTKLMRTLNVATALGEVLEETTPEVEQKADFVDKALHAFVEATADYAADLSNSQVKMIEDALPQLTKYNYALSIENKKGEAVEVSIINIRKRNVTEH